MIDRNRPAIIQPEHGRRNVTDSFYEYEGMQIQRMNKILKGIHLTKSEEETLIWLAGCDAGVVKNVLSVINKAKEIKTVKDHNKVKHRQDYER